MPFRKKGRPYAYVWPTLPGLGRVGPWSTGTADLRLARRMEDYLRELALTQPELVRGIMSGLYTLRDLWVAKLEGRVDALRERAQDPVLASVIERFRPHAKDRRIEVGLEMLERLAEKGARLSWLTNPKNISDICANAIAEGRKPNTVRRSLYRACMDLLSYELGRARMLQIATDVVKPGEDDTRHVEISPEEIQRILEIADPEMRPVIEIALLTGIDRGPLARLQVRHFNEAEGTLLVPDRKAKSRWRTLPLSEAAQAILRKQVAGKGPDEPVFAVDYNGIDNRWRGIRKKAGRRDLRFKDLRHIFATTFVQTGGTVRDVGQVLGHSNMTTPLRYTAAQVRAQRNQMDRVAEALGLGRRLKALADKAGGM